MSGARQVRAFAGIIALPGDKITQVSADKFEAYRAALRRAVAEALVHHPQGSATVDEGVNAEYPYIWGIDITPTAPGAASAYIAYGGGDEVTLGFGETHVYMWDRDPEALAHEVQPILEAVFAGRFVEVGHRGDGFAKLQTPRGEVRVGAFHLPTSWRLRETRSYAPYSAPA